MDPMIYTAMNGARNSLDRQATITHNLANVNTSGFRQQLDATRAVPVNAQGMMDTRTAAVASTPSFDSTAGPVNQTGRPLDVAIRGEGWLAVQAPDGTESYTRRGDLSIDENGMLNSNGRPVLGDGGPIMVPLGAQLTIGEDGTITALAPGQNPNEVAEVDRLKLVSAQPGQLVRGDDGLFRSVNNAPLNADDAVRVVSGALEGSNVSAVEAMVAMISNQRMFDMQMKVVSTADENAQRANSLLSMSG